MTDLQVIRGARIFDGRGLEPFSGDVIIVAGIITDVGPHLATPPGATVTEAHGRELLPGFIDVHSHDDAALLLGHTAPKVRQGVTTTVLGNCGHGCAPSSTDPALSDYSTPVLGPFPDRHWPTFRDYLDDLVTGRFGMNAAALVAHTPIRAHVMGMARRPATTVEVDRIAGLFGDALDAGAVGASLGLMYSPANTAAVEELVAIGQATASRDRLLVAHLRNEADLLLESLEEFAEVGRATGTALHVSHLKVTGPRNMGMMPQVVDRLEQYRAEGLDITADIYPYPAGSTTAATLLPPACLDRGLRSALTELASPQGRRSVAAAMQRPWAGQLENYFHSLGPARIRVAGFSEPDHLEFEGRTLAEIADTFGEGPAETLLELLVAERGNLSVILFQGDPDGIVTAMAWPHTLVGSDGLPHATGYVHPRLYGTFAKIMEAHTGPGRVWSRTEAVRRMTSAAAARFKLSDVGTIEPGQRADMQLVNPTRYADWATFESPRNHPTGVDHVWVRGIDVLADPTAQPGRGEPAVT